MSCTPKQEKSSRDCHKNSLILCQGSFLLMVNCGNHPYPPFVLLKFFKNIFRCGYNGRTSLFAASKNVSRIWNEMTFKIFDCNLPSKSYLFCFFFTPPKKFLTILKIQGTTCNSSITSVAPTITSGGIN
jgi:hypothetical protein